MYRRSLIALWTGTGIFAALAVADALLGFMGHMQGLFIGGMAMCFVSVWIRVGHHDTREATLGNRQKADELRADVDQIRCKMSDLTNKVGEVKSMTRAHIIKDDAEKEAEKKAQEAAEEQASDEQDAIIYQFQIRDPNGHDIIIGSRSSEPVDQDEIYAVIDDTLPGRAGS